METSRERYIKLQNQCGFKIGDTVEVNYRAKDYQFGWPAAWNDSMDVFMYIESKILDINESGIMLNIKNSPYGNYHFPFFVIDLIESVDDKKAEPSFFKKALDSMAQQRYYQTKHKYEYSNGYNDSSELLSNPCNEISIEEDKIFIEDGKKLNIPRI